MANLTIVDGANSSKDSFWKTAPGQLVLSTWFLPTLGAGLSVRRSLQKKRSTSSLVLHAAGSALAIYVGAIALAMSGMLEGTLPQH